MDIKNCYAFENSVAKIFIEAGYTVKQGVQLENKIGDIDIIAEKDKRKFCVEVKYSRITEKAIQQICDTAESNEMIPLLVTIMISSVPSNVLNDIILPFFSVIFKALTPLLPL